MKFAALLALTLFWASSANGLTISVDWAASPRADDLARVYPASARAREIEGYAVVDCAVTGAGGLNDCRVVREGPANEGFGEAAIQLAELFVLRRPSATTNPPTRMNVPIRFSLPKP